MNYHLSKSLLLVSSFQDKKRETKHLFYISKDTTLETLDEESWRVEGASVSLASYDLGCLAFSLFSLRLLFSSFPLAVCLMMRCFVIFHSPALFVSLSRLLFLHPCASSFLSSCGSRLYINQHIRLLLSLRFVFLLFCSSSSSCSDSIPALLGMFCFSGCSFSCCQVLFFRVLSLPFPFC